MGFCRRVAVFLLFAVCFATGLRPQINTTRMLTIGRNALYFEDYILSIQYFNEVIKVKPYLAEPYMYRALAKLNLDDFHGAENDLTLCIERNPFLVRAYFYRGVARQSTGDYSAALSDYDKGLEYRPEDRQMLLNKGIVYIRRKDYDSALVTLDLLLRYHPKMYQAYLTRGHAYAERGDIERAFEDIERSLALNAFFAPAYGQRALLYIEQERYEDAERDFGEAISLEPERAGYYVNRGLARFYLNNLRGAMEDYDTVINMNSEDVVGRFNRGLLRSQVREIGGAIEDFDVVIKNEPRNFMAVYNRAILNEELGRYADAVRDLGLVLEEYPSFVPGYYFRAEVFGKLKDVKASEKDYWFARNLEQELRKAKDEGKVVTGRGVFDTEEEAEAAGAAAAGGRSGGDIERFSRLVVYDGGDDLGQSYGSGLRGRVQDRDVRVVLQPQFVLTYYERAGSLDVTLNHYSRALQTYNSGMLLDMQLKASNREVSLTDMQAEHHFRSIDRYSLLIEQNSEDRDAYFGRALDFMVVRDLSEAVEDYTRVISIDPSFLFAYFNRAAVRYKKLESGKSVSGDVDLRLDLGREVGLYGGFGGGVQLPVSASVEGGDAYEMEQVLRDYSACIRIDSDFVYGWYNRGNIYFIRKDFRAAVSDYSEAIVRNPYFAEAYFNRGLSYLSLGERVKGVSDLSRAGELGLAEAYGVIRKVNDD
ncbi:MAG: tetratricopeptide repeat protein [Dysgonamonadaceae bacterium]|jgi:tetratricopeptide (TPR) repeat protein|nr:tetratricopeptide repeat protein [Dysgonamonadaceae bacterium]